MKINKLLINILFVTFLVGCSDDNVTSVEKESRFPIIRVATYNIQNAYMNGQNTIDDIVVAISKMNADIVGLQEIDNMTKRSVGYDKNKKTINQAQYIADKLGMNFYFCEERNYGKGYGAVGNAILSKHSIKLRKRYEFTSGKEKFDTRVVSCAVDVSIVGYPKPIVAVGAHLYQLKGSVLDRQIDELSMVFSPWVIKDRSYPIIIGDLNIFPKSQEYNRLTLTWTDTDNGEKYTAPSWSPDRKIDYVMTSKSQKWNVKSVWVPNPDDKVSTGKKYLEISDHLPLVVEMQLVEE